MNQSGAEGMMDAWVVKSPKQAMRAIQKEVRISVELILADIKTSMEKTPLDWHVDDGYETICHNRKWLVSLTSNKKVRLYTFDSHRYANKGNELTPLTWWQRWKLKRMLKNLQACRTNFESYQKLKKSLETIIQAKG